MRRASLTFIVVIMAATRAAAWEARPGNVEKRIAAVEDWMGRNPDPRTRDVLAFAKTRKAPSWIKKTYWHQDYAGHTYHFAVGISQGIRNASLRATAAEDRARGEIVKARFGRVTVDEKRAANGKLISQSISTSAKGSTRNSHILDWYLDPSDNSFYALVVQIE